MKKTYWTTINNVTLSLTLFKNHATLTRYVGRGDSDCIELIGEMRWSTDPHAVQAKTVRLWEMLKIMVSNGLRYTDPLPKKLINWYATKSLSSPTPGDN